MTTTIKKAFRDFRHIFVETTHNQYSFAPVTADKIRGGSKADVEGVYVYIGNGMMNNYPAESSLDEVPDAVLAKAQELGTIVEDIDSGWASWGGRPEFDDSVTFVDISTMEIVE